MKNNFLFPFLILFCFISSVVNAQDEYTAPLQYNPAIKSEILKQAAESSSLRTAMLSTDTLLLPFFDDFSVYSVWPSVERWIDSTSFVNFNFGINPPSVGMVTFDGLDERGNPYDNTNTNASGLCDELTSKHLNLFNDDNGLPYDVSDSIFLVFQYQRKGRGDNPELTDSLVLQFYDPNTQVWTTAWKGFGITGGDTVFNKVKLSINDVNYRQNGFRFRFRNYGSKTGMLDLWHVDYISLRKFLPPDYENIRDYTFVYPGVSLLNNYSALPFKHYSFLGAAQQQAFVKSSAALTLRNNNDSNPFPIKVSATLYDQYNNSLPLVGGGGLNNIVIPLNQNLVPPATLQPNTYFQDPTLGEQATFTAVYEIGTTSGSGNVDDFPQNDTLRYVQDFHNYYAYDDGSAELGYGVNGVGASLAYKFEILKGDTLRAFKIYFAQLGTSVTNQIFRLAVWGGGGGGPVGAPVYEKFNQTPNYVDSINGFYTYMTDPVFVPAGTWYFGFIQNNAVLLNLGLDTNTPADASRKFINTSGTWTNSQLPGMWMIRPVFSQSIINTGVTETADEAAFTVYPVPASDEVHVNLDLQDALEYNMTITDLTGRKIFYAANFESTIDVSGFSPGVYMLHVANSVSGAVMSRKILVAGK